MALGARRAVVAAAAAAVFRRRDGCRLRPPPSAASAAPPIASSAGTIGGGSLAARARQSSPSRRRRGFDRFEATAGTAEAGVDLVDEERRAEFAERGRAPAAGTLVLFDAETASRWGLCRLRPATLAVVGWFYAEGQFGAMPDAADFDAISGAALREKVKARMMPTVVEAKKTWSDPPVDEKEVDEARWKTKSTEGE